MFVRVKRSVRSGYTYEYLQIVESRRRGSTVRQHVIATLGRKDEIIADGTPVNLGTMERTRVIDAVHEVLRYTGHNARIELQPDMPTGPLNRVADNSLARRLLGWEPQVPFVEGLRRTIDWYVATRDRDTVRRVLAGGGLLERGVLGAAEASEVAAAAKRPSTPPDGG
jgi:hypothetical protein